MKRMKMGVAIVFSIVIIYFIVSCGIFLFKKSSIDTQLQVPQEKVVDQIMVQPEMKQDESVVIQDLAAVPCKHQISLKNTQADFVVINDEQDELSLQIVVDDKPEFIVSADDDVSEEVVELHSYSFITMAISDDYIIDQEVQDMIDVLIGNNVEDFVKLILQSNNNIVSKEACRSCGMYAFFNGIKNHKSLTSDDVRTLQKLLANLYQFVEKMQKLNKKKKIMGSEQYAALQNLHKSQAVKNDLKLQARRAATSAALKKLQNIKYNR
jgi:hypothetical protein